MRPLPRTRVTVGSQTFDVILRGSHEHPLVVLLHGFPQSADSWQTQIATLVERGFRVAALDQRGYSPAARPSRPSAYALSYLVTDVLAIARTLEADRFHVVGHDWGGVVAWQLGAAHADRLLSVAVVSTPHPRALLHALRSWDQRGRSAYVALFRSPLAEPLLLGGQALALRVMLQRTGLPRDWSILYAQRMLQPGVLRAALNWYRANGTASFRAVGRISVPTTYIWGSKDPALGPDAARRTSEYVRGPYRFVTLDAGHWIPECAGTALTTLLREHLAHVGR